MATFIGHCTGFSYLFFSLSLPEWLDLQDCFYIGSTVGGKKFVSPQHSLHTMTKGLYHAKQVIIKAKFMVAVHVSCCIILFAINNAYN